MKTFSNYKPNGTTNSSVFKCHGFQQTAMNIDGLENLKFAKNNI